MPFGLRNAGNTFQRMMDRILAGLSFVFCYLDDIIIASRDEEEHLEHLREVFSRLREAGLVINAEKCVFAATAVEFLGHKVSAAGVEPLLQPRAGGARPPGADQHRRVAGFSRHC